MKKIFALIMGSLALLASCSSSDSDIIEEEENNVPAASSQTITIPTEQVAGSSVFDGEANAVQLSQAVGGIKLNFQLSGITRIELESVDGYALAGNATVDLTGSEPAITAVTDSQSIITLEAPEGQTLTPGKDYYITTLPCNVYGGYRLSIYKDGLKADYYGVHQVITAGSYISPTDLIESELDFEDPDAPFVEDERPQLDATTQACLVAYQKNPTDDNKDALLTQMGIRYDKVVARKKAKLRELERDAHDQSLIDQMQDIVDEMVDNREIRLEEQFLRLVDPRTDDNPNDQWMVLRGDMKANNAYIGYAPVTNKEYAAYDKSFTYPAGQDNYPVVNITVAQATAYCDWLSAQDNVHAYRLPTEEEWVLAAGHMPKDVSMNSDHVERGLTAVDAYAQTTGACGGIDFWGNCWEWTTTPNAAGLYIVKGGAWDSSRDACRTEYSDDARDPQQGYDNVGFRVVRVNR